jgi:hypothetical protein
VIRLQVIGMLLVNSIDWLQLNATQLTKASRRDALVKRSLRMLVALIAITEGVFEHGAIRAEANIVHGPAIDSDRTYTFGRNRSAFREALIHSGDDARKIPPQTAIAMLGLVSEPMN